MAFETVTINGVGKIRRETLNGRKHIVAPLTMISEGVLNGNNGPLYYPATEITKDPMAWNHMPIVNGHPYDQGKAISARQPNVLNQYSLGVILNAKGADTKLQAEAWFDEELTKLRAPTVFNRLERGEPIELSTGLFLDEVAPDNGTTTFNGREFKSKAVNYRPDHLAVFNDGQVGACSINDGCGVFVNESLSEKEAITLWDRFKAFLNTTPDPTQGETMSKLTDNERKDLVDFVIANSCGCWEESDRTTLNGLTDEKLTKLKTNAEATKAKAEEKPAETPKTETPAATVANAEAAKPKTEDEWLADAPAGIRQMIANSREIMERERTQLIEKLTANVEDAQKTILVNHYKGMELGVLRDLASAVKEPTAAPESTGFVRRSSYAGAAPTANGSTPTFNRESYLPLPKLDWAAEAGKN